MQQLKTVGKLLLLLFITARILIDPSLFSAALCTGVDVCLRHIIPSLFALMALSEIIIRSGCCLLGVLFRPVMRYIFHLNDTEGAIFLISQFAGYPVGLSMLMTAVADGLVAKERARRMSLYCFCAGPGFLVSLIGLCVYGEPMAGWLIYGANVTMNLLLALILRGEKPQTDAATDAPSLRLGTAIVMGTQQAALNLMRICALMLVMQVFCTAVLPLLPTGEYQLALAALADISHAVDFPKYQTLWIPLLSALTAFGGICVCFQLCSIGRGLLRFRTFLTARLFSAAGSYLICWLLVPVVLRDYAAPTVSGSFRAAASQQPVLSVILLLMTAMLALEWRQMERKKALCK